MNTRRVLVISGGHLSPAYAVAKDLKQREKTISLVFIGRRRVFASAEQTSNSIEEQIMCSLCNYTHIIDIPRPREGIAFIRSVISIAQFLSSLRPRVVVSFGGYVGTAVGIAAIIRGIPLVIHEQTHSFGMGNAALRYLASAVCVSYEDMAKGRYIYTGFPLRYEILHPPDKPSIPFLSSRPILYVTGGTTGAVFVNDLFFRVARVLLTRYVIAHQTGLVSWEKATMIRDMLPIELKNRYYIAPYIDPPDASWLLHNAKFVVSRAGANSVYELAVTKTPSLLIPLPLQHEQKVNAEWLAFYAPTVLLHQKDASDKTFIKSINALESLPKREYLSVPIDGTKRLCDVILSYL